MDYLFESVFLPICAVIYVFIVFTVISYLLMILRRGEVITFPSQKDLKLKGRFFYQLLAGSPMASGGFASIWLLMKEKDHMNWIIGAFGFQIIVSLLISYISIKISVGKKQKWLAYVFVILPYIITISSYFLVDEKLKPDCLLMLSFFIGPALCLLTASLLIYKKPEVLL